MAGSVLPRQRAPTERGAADIRGRSPDSQVIAVAGCLPVRWTVACRAGRSLLTVAGPCGNLTRFPFHSPQWQAPRKR